IWGQSVIGSDVHQVVIAGYDPWKTVDHVQSRIPAFTLVPEPEGVGMCPDKVEVRVVIGEFKAKGFTVIRPGDTVANDGDLILPGLYDILFDHIKGHRSRLRRN